MTIRTVALALVLSTLTAACGGAAAPSTQATIALSPDVTERGEPIYVGTVFPIEEGSKVPSFVYERRVAREGRDLVSTHVTRDPKGGVAIAESATHAPDYELATYELHRDQRGRSGSVRVDGSRVEFRLSDAEGIHEAEEERTDPVVVGPTLVGHIVHHLDELRRGETLQVRMAILERLETIGFDLRSVPAEPGQTKIRMEPSSFFIGLAVDPIDFTFETASRKLVRLEGRVPPKSTEGGELRDFDARVEYRFVAATYR